MQCKVMQCNVMQCNAMQRNAVQWNAIQLHGTVSFLKTSECVWVAASGYLTQWSSPIRSPDPTTGSRSPRSCWERLHPWTERCPEGLPVPRWSPCTAGCPALRCSAATGRCSGSPCLPCWRTGPERESHISLEENVFNILKKMYCIDKYCNRSLIYLI